MFQGAPSDSDTDRHVIITKLSEPTLGHDVTDTSPGTTHLAGTRRLDARDLEREANRRAQPVPGPAPRGAGGGTGGEMARVAPVT
jgi:hypothetical protein